MPITILCRPGGTWRPIETMLLQTTLQVPVIGKASHPEYLLLRGHFEKHHTLPTMLGHTEYTVEKVVGRKHPRLPFEPHWF